MPGTGTRRRKAGGAAGAAKEYRARISVAEDERRHLIEACAFFRADHFRPAEPGCYRTQDLKDAATEIDAVLKRGVRKTRKR